MIRNIFIADIEIEAVTEPNLDEIEKAWRYSRPNEKEVSLREVLRTDIPVNEFARFSVQMTIPIILREWIVTFRDHIVWARTSRVDDLTSWPVHRSVDLEATKAAYDRMVDDMSSDQDHFRRHLTLGYMTGLSASLSFRSWMKLVKSAELAAGLLPSGSPMADIFSEFASSLLGCLPKSELITAAYEATRGDFPCAKNFSVDEEGGESVGGFFVGRLSGVSLSLRAQLARHRPIMLRDNLWELIGRPDILSASIHEPMQIEFACSSEIATRLATKRNCWIAQEDLWLPVLRLINSSRGKPILPCDNGPCTALRDNRLRKEGLDPAPPCPRYANLNNEKLTTAQEKRAREYLDLRPSTRDFWEKEINDAI